MKQNKILHRGRIQQIIYCLPTQFRMFFYLEWKGVPMSALVAGMVALVTARGMFDSMEGTLKGALALSCICVWNGFFNSIQLVCRERDVVKREHRNGMFVSSYVASHMIVQASICAIQTVITIWVCKMGGMKFPASGYLDSNFYREIGFTLFLITFASDMLSLLISCLARTTTDAMTAMPFLLIAELVFSDVIFSVGERLRPLTNLSFVRWGVRCLSAQSGYNSLPMTSVWSMMSKVRDIEVSGLKPVDMTMDYIVENDMVEEFNLMVGSYNQIEEYATSVKNILNAWYALILFAFVLALLCVIVLKQIDKDKR